VGIEDQGFHTTVGEEGAGVFLDVTADPPVGVGRVLGGLDVEDEAVRRA
jgi:hypothetical protein